VDERPSQKISLPNLNNSGRPLGHQEAFAYMNLTNASLLSAALRSVSDNYDCPTLLIFMI
jgi:hypothetical protein